MVVDGTESSPDLKRPTVIGGQEFPFISSQSTRKITCRRSPGYNQSVLKQPITPQVTNTTNNTFSPYESKFNLCLVPKPRQAIDKKEEEGLTLNPQNLLGGLHSAQIFRYILILTGLFTMNPLTNMKNVLKLSEQELHSNSKTSWHDQYRNSAWIFIGGLPYDLTEGDVICIFSQYGEVVNINLVRDKASGKQKGFCFLCYEDQRSTILAVDNFNGIKILGRTIRVDHVEDYKAPKESKNMTAETARLHEEGCAVDPVKIKTEPHSPKSKSSNYKQENKALIKKVKKEEVKKDKKDKEKENRKRSSKSVSKKSKLKKKKRYRSSSSSSSSSDSSSESSSSESD